MLLPTLLLALSLALSSLQAVVASHAVSSIDFAPPVRDLTARPSRRFGTHKRMARRRQGANNASSDPMPIGVDGVGPQGTALPRQSAQANGVTNSLGRDQDPSPLTYTPKNGQKVYLFPTGDFGKNVLYRRNTSLTDVYSVDAKVLYAFDTAVGTEASDLMAWDNDTALLTVSATSDNTLRAVTFSQASFFNGGSGNFASHGTIKDQSGTALQGFDSHVFAHPNGNRYLTYSNHVSIRIARMTSYNQVTGDSILVSTMQERRNPVQQLLPNLEGNNSAPTIYNTEAPSTVVLPNERNGSSTINLGFATGDFNTANYNTRLMYIDSDQDPLQAANWYLTKQAFLQSSSANQAYGPGSGGFFSGPDDQPWFSYGAFDRSQGHGDPNSNYPRTIRVQSTPANDQGILLPNTAISTPRHNTPGH